MSSYIYIDFGENCSTERIPAFPVGSCHIKIDAPYEEELNVMQALLCEVLFNGYKI